MVQIPFSPPNKEINLPWYAYLMYVSWKVHTAVTSIFNMRPERRKMGNKLKRKRNLLTHQGK